MADDRLIDIVPPAAPPGLADAGGGAWELWLLFGGLLIGVGVVLFGRRLYWRVCLALVCRRADRGELGTREAARATARLLRRRLRLTHLRPSAPPDGGNAAAWARLVHLLDALSYGPHARSRAFAARALRRAGEWLR